MPNFAGNLRSLPQGDAESDAFTDSRLVKLAEVWPTLSGETRAAILSLAGLRPGVIDDLAPVNCEGDESR